MKIKLILILTILVSINSMAYCLEDDNELTEEEEYQRDKLWIDEYNQRTKTKFQREKEKGKRILEICKGHIDESLADAWQDVKLLIENDIEDFSPEELKELKQMIDTIDKNINDIPRLLLLLWVQLEVYMTTSVINTPYGPPIGEKRKVQGFIKRMRSKLLHFELIHNNALTDVQRLRLLEKGMPIEHLL
ncbi:hypothetical protein HRU45_04690 [Candidatus Dependentiae bacterium]|nr:hypothetical protein [Candidatus Dependentiae bacterium]